MAAPVINSRPFKTISGYGSLWNAGGGNLPLLYQIENDKFPIPSGVSPYTWVSTADNGSGNARITLVDGTGLAVDDYVYLDSPLYEGIFRITEKNSFLIDINTSYLGNSTGTFKAGFPNYKTEIDIYAGVPAGHPLNSDDPIALIGTMDLIPDSDNITYADIKGYVQRKLSSFNNAGDVNDIGLWAGFYVIVRESYDTAYATRVTSSNVDDSANTLYAAYAALPFGYQYGGNMYEYTNDAGRTEAKWLNANPVTFFYNRPYWDISAIVNVDTFDLIVEQYQDDGILLQTDTLAYTGQGAGIYRFDLSGVILFANTVSLNCYIEISSVRTSEIMIVEVDLSLCGQDFLEIGNFMLYEDEEIMLYEDDDKMVYEL